MFGVAISRVQIKSDLQIKNFHAACVISPVKAVKDFLCNEIGDIENKINTEPQVMCVCLHASLNMVKSRDVREGNSTHFYVSLYNFKITIQ